MASSENASGYSPISGAIDDRSPSVGALFSAEGKPGIVVCTFEKDRVEPWWLVRAMCGKCVGGLGYIRKIILC